MTPPIDEESVSAVARLLRGAERVVSFSGAGLSKASGIPTYRDAGGLWTQEGNLRFSSVDALQSDPDGFRRFWLQRQQELQRAVPNAAHAALARLDDLRPDVRHVTQNVDGLLVRAGCRTVYELHGSLGRYRCDRCGAGPFDPQDTCPRCGSPARPDVVMFGEMLPDRVYAEAELSAKRCDVLLVVGTSAVVHPAAGLVQKAATRGARIVVVNPEPCEVDDLADVILRGRAEEVLPAVVAGVGSNA